MLKRLPFKNIICSSRAGKKLPATFIFHIRISFLKVLLAGMLCLFSALYMPCFAGEADCAAAQEAVESGELDPEDYADMFPFCNGDSNIDMPLDDGVPFLFIAAALFGAIKIHKRQSELKGSAGLDK